LILGIAGQAGNDVIPGGVIHGKDVIPDLIGDLKFEIL